MALLSPKVGKEEGKNPESEGAAGGGLSVGLLLSLVPAGFAMVGLIGKELVIGENVAEGADVRDVVATLPVVVASAISLSWSSLSFF